MSIAPSQGMLKKVFDPANFKKKMKTARGYAKSTGENSKKFDTKAAGKYNFDKGKSSKFGSKDSGGSKNGSKMKLMAADDGD